MIAWGALIVWPMVGIYLFQKYSLATAISVTIIGGFLLLPEGIGLDLPVLPTLDKDSIPSLTALLMTIVKLSQRARDADHLQGWIPRGLVAPSLLVLLGIGTLGIVFTNQDALVYGPLILPGMQVYDGFSLALSLLIALVPLILARRVLATPEAQRILLVVLAVSALLYTIPTLWEIRMSPQLHRQVYGFFQHSFLQQVRNDGFRSMVFLSHGLTLSIFLSLAILSAAAMVRIAEPKQRVKWGVGAIWLLAVLVLNKSLGALVIVICFLPLVLFMRPRLQLLVAACFAGVVLTYPVMRVANVIPTERVLALAESIDPQRAQSFGFRLDNEDILLEKAREQPVFGWGGFGRSRVYAPNGRDISITDGEWIIHFGVGGWFRYIGIFGLLCWPIIGLFLSKRDRIDPVCAMLALVLAAKMVDLIPNSGLAPYIWLIAGSLMGRLEIQLSDRKVAATDATLTGKTGPRYSRAFARTGDDEIPEANVSERRPSYTRATSIKHRRTE